MNTASVQSNATAELWRNPISKHQIQPEYIYISRPARDGTAEPVSRDQILRRERGQGNIHFPCSAARHPSGLVGKLHICSTEVVSSILTKVGFVFFLS